jgi:hypothetical protein
MSKSSTSVTRKALKLDDKVKAITLCDGGKSCRAVANKMGDGRTQIMNILIIKRDILDVIKISNNPGYKLSFMLFTNHKMYRVCLFS